MLSGSNFKKLVGKKWNTTFSFEDVKKVFDEQGPLRSIINCAFFNLAWFVETVFRNVQGKPLRLEAFQVIMLDMLWHKKFPMLLASRGAGKTFILAVYAVLRALLIPGSKIVICGAGYRQAKLVFKEIEKLYNSSPILQEACQDRPKYGSDQAYLNIGHSTITAIPIGDGEKIRGIRATTLIADEFGSIPEEIFEIVISPFTAVHMNPAERAMVTRFVNRLKALNADNRLIELIESTQGFGNQIVVSGTSSYKHNHFYKRYRVYKMFIESRGDPQKLKKFLESSSMENSGKSTEISNEDITVMAKLWKHYAIYQLPYTGIPEGFLDADIIRADRAKFPRHRFAMEYLVEFPDDSDGFIKRSWIEAATPHAPEFEPVKIELYGDPRSTYVMGLDPARWNDNFGCVVLKLTPRGKELVYCTAWNRTEFSVSAKKIREICKRFNISYIAMDGGGGGWATYEWLCKEQSGVSKEELIWLIPEQLEERDRIALAAPGKKILEVVNFGGNWTVDAAHSLAASIQQNNLLFPYKVDEQDIYNQYVRHFKSDSIDDQVKEFLCQDVWGIDEWEAGEISSKAGVKHGAVLGVKQHIDECINETCAILRTVTPGGVERFELPAMIDQPEGLDMRRRDRFSALMLANYASKVYQGSLHKVNVIPGLSPNIRNKNTSYTRRGPRRKGSVTY